jgi:hypothetical protein
LKEEAVFIAALVKELIGKIPVGVASLEPIVDDSSIPEGRRAPWHEVRVGIVKRDFAIESRLGGFECVRHVFGCHFRAATSYDQQRQQVSDVQSHDFYLRGSN